MSTGQDIRTDAQDTLLDLFNNTLAGQPASHMLNDALAREWLPAVARLLRDQSPASPDHTLVRRLMVRLSWLLKHLPQAESIHAALLDRAIAECRADWRALANQLYGDGRQRVRQVQLLDRELLDPLVASGNAHSYRPVFDRKPIAPMVSTRVTTMPVHPHDRSATGAWRVVLAGSRERRRDEDDAKHALARVSRLRAGDRVIMLLPGGLKETWRVLRRETTRDNVLLENENTHRQGVLGLQTMAAQLEQGRLAILG